MHLSASSWTATTCLLFLSAARYATSLTNWEQIHQTIHVYPLAIDGKDFGRLAEVFSQDAVANYTGPLANLTGLPAISTALAGSVAKVDSQHLLGTTVIDIGGDKDKANATTYVQATLFGKPYYPGSSVTIFGYYVDRLSKLKQGWRVTHRDLLFQGPGFVGNTSLLGG